MNLNADEWNKKVSEELQMPIAKIKTLITYRELILGVGKLRLHINRNLITKVGQEQLRQEKAVKKEFDALLHDEDNESMSTLKNFVVSTENNTEIITAMACTGKIIIGIDFSDSQLDNSYFNHCIFYNCNFSDSNMESSFITSCNFVECDLSNTDFLTSSIARNSFLSCNMTKVNFTYAVLSDNTFVNCDISNSTFLQTRLLYTGFNECIIEKGSFRDTEFGQVSIINSNLNDSNFKNAYIMDCIAIRTDFIKCNFDNFTSAAFTMASCNYDDKYKKLFGMDNLVHNPALFEWENEVDK